MNNLTEKDSRRFWSKVDKGEPDSCWNWNAGTDKEGYGRFGKFNKALLSHRIAYELSYGIDPGDFLVLHSCDNPACCNPKHLSIGTYLDNNRDRANKGRSADNSGEHHPSHKLTHESVKEIRATYAAGGWTHRALANKYNVSYGAIQKAIALQTWKESP